MTTTTETKTVYSDTRNTGKAIHKKISLEVKVTTTTTGNDAPSSIPAQNISIPIGINKI